MRQEMTDAVDVMLTHRRGWLRRARPRVGMTEMRSLLQDPHAPSPAKAAAMGSRNALSPMRAAPKMRTGLGHAQVLSLHLPANLHRT